MLDFLIMFLIDKLIPSLDERKTRKNFTPSAQLSIASDRNGDNISKLNPVNDKCDSTRFQHDDVEKNPFLYCLSLVNTQKDDNVRRGARVKAMAVCTRHQWIHIFKVIFDFATYPILSPYPTDVVCNSERDFEQHPLRNEMQYTHWPISGWTHWNGWSTLTVSTKNDCIFNKTIWKVTIGMCVCVCLSCTTILNRYYSPPVAKFIINYNKLLMRLYTLEERHRLTCIIKSCALFSLACCEVCSWLSCGVAIDDDDKLFTVIFPVLTLHNTSHHSLWCSNIGFATPAI